ncbi:seminase [Drosophila tropicalis]|uniref:seminase n=1 Tax=Drosophila tropicalis TaxID=46794 RepID=UPI0035ABE5FC
MRHLLLAFCAVLHLLHVQGQDTNMTYELKDVAKKFLPPAYQARVIGGEVTTNEKLGGYLVALRYYGDFICGGTLIHDYFVVTAAHCFLGRSNKYQWTIEGGISTLDDTNGIKSEMKDYKVPLHFREDDMHMDVAVVQLRKPLKGHGVGKLKLCHTPLVANLTLTVAGWGLVDTRSSQPHNYLRKADVPVMARRECRRVYWPSVKLTDSMFCAALLGQKDACTFDSGGPLAYKKQLCGIVSFGIGCASNKYPGVYTDVNYVKPFIKNAITSLNQS